MSLRPDPNHVLSQPGNPLVRLREAVAQGLSPGEAKEIVRLLQRHADANAGRRSMPFQPPIKHLPLSQPPSGYGVDDSGPLHAEVEQALTNLEVDDMTSRLQARMAQHDRPSPEFARLNRPNAEPSLRESIEASASLHYPDHSQEG